MYTDWNRGGQVEQASGRPPRSKAERLVEVSALDGRSSPSMAYLRLTPRRVQNWWSLQELARPTIMREGRWLA